MSTTGIDYFRAWKSFLASDVGQELAPLLADGTGHRFVLTLPHPELCTNKPPLTPGARMVRAKLTRDYRAQAKRTARAVATTPEDGAPQLRSASARLIFWFQDKRRRDIRNFEAGMKPAYDGLVDAGVIIDDCSDVLTHAPTIFKIDGDCPRVEIIILNKAAA